MKKILCLALSLIMVLSCMSVFAKDAALKVGDISIKNGSFDANDAFIRGLSRGDSFGFKGVDLTGMNSVSMKLNNTLYVSGGNNGDTYLIMIDSPENGKIIGNLTIMPDFENTDVTVKAAIEPVTGVHDLYFYSLYGNGTTNYIAIKEITLSEEKVTKDVTSAKVDDSKIIDLYSDTWVGVDNFGRAVATYEEVGGVKEGLREVGMLYWNWRADSSNRNAAVIPEIIAANPGSREDYFHKAWDIQGKYFWGEPVFGFYDSFDYWTYRKHAEMFAIAGVDSLFLDYSNGGNTYQTTIHTLAQALRDAKSTGVDAPKLCVMLNLGVSPDNAARAVSAIYYTCFVENDYTDIWYYKDGAPLLYGWADYKNYESAMKTDAEKALFTEIDSLFNVKYNGPRNGEAKIDEWMWLENFPQTLRDVNPETGRVGYVVVGVGINQSTIYGQKEVGAFSSEYCKGRAFSEAFGEDYTEKGMREAYFFREQAAFALDADPEFMMIDGWNEWDAIRFESYGRNKNAFVDLFDYENSRDFEPNRGPLKDDCYNMLIDLVRKYKGARKAPVASGMKTIDLAGDASQWAEVGPYFVNSYQDYERNVTSYGKYGKSGERWEYTTKVVNSIKGAKATFDNDNIYFMAECEKDIRDSENFMTLYLNTDRNYATGWEGYDYIIEKGVVSKFGDGPFGKTNVANVNYTIKGNMMQLAIPRSVIGETGVVDLELKWSDSVDVSSDYLNFYSDGSVAPYGKLNYLFTEIEQTALADADRKALKETSTSVLKAGSPKLIACGAKRYTLESDIRVAPVEMNGTLYVPEDAYNEIMEYGHSKTEYDSANNTFYTYHYDLNADKKEIVNNTFTYSVLGSNEVRVNGVAKTLTAPVVYENGRFMIPLTLISDCYGWEVKSLGNGIYTVSKSGAPEANVNSVLSHLN
ncbi:MAG: hypothetical protein Q4G23_00630 [Clostridia bacterium]|nr:hypothetical protein [Clostridia bacterium]